MPTTTGRWHVDVPAVVPWTCQNSHSPNGELSISSRDALRTESCARHMRSKDQMYPCLLCMSPNDGDVISFTTNRMTKAFRPKANSLCKWTSLAATQPNFPQWGNKIKWVCGSDLHGNWPSWNKGKRSLIRTMRLCSKSEKQTNQIEK